MGGGIFLARVKNIPLCIIYEVCLLKEYNAQCLQKRNPKKNVEKLCGERKPYGTEEAGTDMSAGLVSGGTA